MKITYDIEFDIVDGKVTFEQSEMTENYQVIPVEFEADPRWENDGIGSYEYWGAKGYDHGHDYISLEEHGDPSWDKTNHCKTVNTLIEEFSNSNKWESLCEMFCDAYKEECEKNSEI